MCLIKAPPLFSIHDHSCQNQFYYDKGWGFCLFFLIDVAPNLLTQGSPVSGLQTGISCPFSSSIRLEIKCAVSVMHLNHLKTIPPTPPVGGKIVFHEIGPWCQKGWGPLYNQHLKKCSVWKIEPCPFELKRKGNFLQPVRPGRAQPRNWLAACEHLANRGQRALELRVGAPEFLSWQAPLCLLYRKIFFPNFSFSSTDNLLCSLPSFPTASRTFPLGCPVVTLNSTWTKSFLVFQQCHNYPSHSGWKPESPLMFGISFSLITVHQSPNPVVLFFLHLSQPPSFPSHAYCPPPLARALLASCLDCCSEQLCLQTLPGLTRLAHILARWITPNCFYQATVILNILQQLTIR